MRVDERVRPGGAYVDSGSSKAAPPLRGNRIMVNIMATITIRAALKLPLHCGTLPGDYGDKEFKIRAALKLPLHCGPTTVSMSSRSCPRFGQL